MISTQKIAFVDMDRVYAKFQMRKLAEREIDIRKKKYREKIDGIDRKIRQLEMKQAFLKTAVDSADIGKGTATAVTVIESTVTGKSVVISTQTETEVKTSTPTADLVSTKEVIEKQIDELKVEKNKIEADAKKNLKSIKTEYSKQVMARIYDAIERVARRRGFDVVVNRSEVLYGIPETDLTDEVLEELK
ncbi:MAG: OmpH family outer membrane protein [Elusimicrobia bacterium]|nr:OmpH family outer membrane protein [Elusimicrobiota bacterium]